MLKINKIYEMKIYFSEMLIILIFLWMLKTETIQANLRN